jgi:hypothetical protein
MTRQSLCTQKARFSKAVDRFVSKVESHQTKRVRKLVQETPKQRVEDKTWLAH